MNYKEYLIEVDNTTNMVYVSGLDKDDFWITTAQFEDVNNTEEFAEGYAQALRDKGMHIDIVRV